MSETRIKIEDYGWDRATLTGVQRAKIASLGINLDNINPDGSDWHMLRGIIGSGGAAGPDVAPTKWLVSYAYRSGIQLTENRRAQEGMNARVVLEDPVNAIALIDENPATWAARTFRWPRDSEEVGRFTALMTIYSAIPVTEGALTPADEKRLEVAW